MERGPIRDRTLVLRILVPGLEARLRDKMKEVEDSVGNTEKDSILDLDGVSCEPTEQRNRTIWKFHCDGAVYPARLVNLPCPVEIMKTHDHAYYYKCVDIAQMLIVYEDEMNLEEELEEKPIDGFPSYYHSGLTPPMQNVVSRRFAAREHSASAPPRSSVSYVEDELINKIEQFQDKNKRNKSVTSNAKVLEEEEYEIVDYEPWMDDFGKAPQGITFDADDNVAKVHPEIWLEAKVIEELRQKHEGTSTSPAKKVARASAPKQPEPAAKPAVDDVTHAATSLLTDDADFDLEGDDGFDFDLDEDGLPGLGDLEGLM